MARSSKEAFKALYAIAQEQQGFFTAKQAITAGFKDSLHAYHVQQGNWIREYRGIYRFASYPPVERPDLMIWYLWSRNRDDISQGVFSHQTALGIHELSDINPSAIHMIVPKRFRRNSITPKILVLHFDDLSSNDIQVVYGVRITEALRTILDLVREGKVEEDLLLQAIKEGIKRGIITMRQIYNLKIDPVMDPGIKKFIEVVRKD